MNNFNQGLLKRAVVPDASAALVALAAVECLCAYVYASIYIFSSRLENMFSSPIEQNYAWWAFAPRRVVGLVELPMTALLLALTLMAPRLSSNYSRFKSATRDHEWQPYLVFNLLAVCATGVLSIPLFHESAWLAGREAWISLSWTVALFTAVGAGVMMLAPPSIIRKIIRTEWISIVGGGVLATAGRFLGSEVIKPVWDGQMSRMTLEAVSALLRIPFPNMQVDAPNLIIKVEGFAVRVMSGCSGIEGILLVTSFLGIYMFVFRRELQMSRAIWLIPLAVICSWLLNVVRIAVLVALGVAFSPEVAMKGFHSHAGWIFFLVLAAIFSLTLRSKFFLRFASAEKSEVARSRAILDRITAFYIPLLTLLAATLISSALSPEFQWLYPLRVVATGVALAYCWRWLSLKRPLLTWVPLLTGVAVFIVWLLMIPKGPEVNQSFAAHLQSVSPALSACWIVFRCIGAIVTVPLAEELAFRGYGLSALTGKAIDPAAPLKFNWVAFLGTSLFFGALHGQWLAGTVAGMCYAWVRYRSQSVVDAILAHAITNGLLCGYVLMTGNWSYW